MHKRQLTIIIVGTLVTVILFVVTTFHQQAQNKSQIQHNEPTLIQDGVMTEKQKKHSKLYKGHPKLENLILKDKDIKMIIGEPYPTNKFGGVSLPSQEIYFQDVLCRTNTVVTAKVESKSSQISEDKKTVFTDYELEIKNIITNNSPVNLQSGDNITLTRSGGAIKINDHIIDIIDKSNKLLVKGNDYLLFLNYLDDSDSFTTSDINGVFEVSENDLTRFSDTSLLYKKSDVDLIKFSNFIQNTAHNCFQ